MRISEQAKQSNRARILEKAAEIFIANGFDATTTRDIALAAGLAAGTLFNYFPSKETLAMTMVTEALGLGRNDFQRRRTGNEDLTEELFLFVASGLRRLRPLRPFLGPALERSLSPFPRKNICPQGEAARLEHLAVVQEIMGRHGFTQAPDYVAMTMYWSLYLGILAFWASDESPNQEATQSLIDYSIRMFVQVISGAGQDGEEIMPNKKIIETELLDLLPKDRSTDPTGKQLAALLTRIALKRVPVNSFFRIWTLGSLQAKVTAGYLAYWLRSRFSDAEQKQRLKSEAHLAAALQLFGTMGYLRGAVMKVGQLLANLPEVVPEEFAEVLSALHFEAPPMHYSLVREVFLDEFGKEPEEMFAVFDRTAFAAASLGQVHRARLHSGEEVAVKIQYPGIARTIKNDLRNLRFLLQPMCLTKDWQDTLTKLADIKRMLLMETDYEQEARFGKLARSVFTDADRVVVPQVFDDYSTKRVLTTEYLAGCHIAEFLATNPGQAARNHFTHVLTVATYRIYYRLHWLPADPHPGNFIFMTDGRLGMIDFGCTLALSEEDWAFSNEAIQAALDNDEPRLNRAIARACLYDKPEDMEPDRLQVIRDGFYWFMEPWQQEGLFDFGDKAFFLRGIDNVMEAFHKRYTRSRPMTTWSNRFTFGGRAFCYKLQGRCAFREIYERESAWVRPE